ncbi:MAG: hypothetical protein IPO21_12610 [Bacteroidales bacterium]|nr:hypothetical protein [Bacteroidales bacterium]
MQRETGILTEELVKEKLVEYGITYEKPIPDVGIDFIVWKQKDITACIQVKGRGEIQTNKKYRWFQIRTKDQREKAIEVGLDVSEAWRIKVDYCDFFILVSLKYDEHWVFPKEKIIEIIEINSAIHGKRKDNITGSQAEISLDIQSDGIYLFEKYKAYLNNYSQIVDFLNK